MGARSVCVGVLFVCTGNICRSPTAAGVFAGMVRDAGLSGRVRVDSAGTYDYHPGEPPDPRSQRAAARRGYDLSGQRARVICEQDFEVFDYILAMDRSHLAILKRRCPSQHRGKLQLFLSYADGLGADEVPDPYFGEGPGFEVVLDLVELAAKGLLEHVRHNH
ncbi:MAG: low molecular weight protein-tyrosine-phosphatase [Planctomycetota bacterium]|jgi:protein-tyrosine phosphatase